MPLIKTSLINDVLAEHGIKSNPKEVGRLLDDHGVTLDALISQLHNNMYSEEPGIRQKAIEVGLKLHGVQLDRAVQPGAPVVTIEFRTGETGVVVDEKRTMDVLIPRPN